MLKLLKPQISKIRFFLGGTLNLFMILKIFEENKFLKGIYISQESLVIFHEQ